LGTRHQANDLPKAHRIWKATNRLVIKEAVAKEQELAAFADADSKKLRPPTKAT
jgi:predicted  nucleic acid-binding Zn ribbon protein